jgi:hypothetical protein
MPPVQSALMLLSAVAAAVLLLTMLAITVTSCA